jgi:hypothetical protein
VAYNSVGNLLFYNAAGQQITGGSINSSPIAAYIAGSASTGSGKAQLYIVAPQSANPATWTSKVSDNGAATTNPITSGAPSNLENLTTPVYAGTAADNSISTYLTVNGDDPSNPDPGYFQLRVYTGGTTFNSADIYVDTTNDTWTLAYSYDAFGGGTSSVPTPVGTSVSLSTTAGTTGLAGTAVPLTATVADADGSSPAGGTVQFYAGGHSVGLPVTVSGDTANYTYPTTAADEPGDSFTAQFTPASGTNYSVSPTSNPVLFGVTAPVATNTVLTASPTSPVITGTSVTFTAKVTDTDASTPTGTITFNDGSTPLDSTVSLTDVSGTYEAQYTTNSLSVATHSLNAVYNAPTGYASSTGALSFQVTPSGDTTSTALAVSPTQVGPGAPVAFSATVSDTVPADISDVPTGTVQFTINGANVGGPVTLNGQGVATANVTAAISGSGWSAYVNGVADNEISAVFTPNSSEFQTSNSGNVEVFVTATGYGSDTNANGTGNIQTSVAPGTLTISTPWTTTNPFKLGALQLQGSDSEYKASANFGNPSSTGSLTANGGVEITDTGIGNQSWTASASVTDFTDGAATPGSADVINGQNLSFTGATVGAISGNDYVAAPSSAPGVIPITPDNAINTLPNSFPYGSSVAGSDGLSNGEHVIATSTSSPTQHEIASSGAAGAGSVFIDGVLTLVAPTSVNAGSYTATLTFTAV